jgi:radical SAM protein with 4Fe4S-binding SPASM domain
MNINIVNLKRAIYTLPNWVSYFTGFCTPYPVGYNIICITKRCNLKCKMCNIWQESPSDDLINASTLARTISNSIILSKTQIVTFTGGEPFLRKDLSEIIIELFSKTNIKKVIIATNGVLGVKILKDLNAVFNHKSSAGKQVSIQVSLDGIGEVHDRIRGVEGTFGHVNSTIEKLKELKTYYGNRLRIGITSIFQYENKDDFKNVYRYAFNNDIDFGYGIIINTEYNKVKNSKYNRSLLADIKEEDLTGLSEDIKDALISWLSSEEKIRKMRCFAGFNSVFWDTNGDIYPCHHTSHLNTYKMGNVLESDFDTLWKSENANLVRSRVKKCGIKGDCMLGGCNMASQKVQYCLPHYLVKLFTLGKIDLYKKLGLSIMSEKKLH